MSGYRVSAYRFFYPSFIDNRNWGLLGIAVTEPKAEEPEEENAARKAADGEESAESAADVKIAYNTFANDVDYNHTNHNFVSVTSGLSIGYDYKGGTDTEEALNDARNFFWNDSATKVAVLITDGAPQQDGATGPELDARVKAAAEALKSNITQDLTIYVTIRNGGWAGTNNGLIIIF